jgi:hypothetical protein
MQFNLTSDSMYGSLFEQVKIGKIELSRWSKRPANKPLFLLLRWPVDER